jgi:mRNA interferase MazF
MKRGDLVVGTAAGDYGKPHPWLVVQSDLVPRDFSSVTLCPLTTDLTTAQSFRVRAAPTSENGLRIPSDVMVDKIQSLPRSRIRSRIGALRNETMRAVDAALRIWLGLA